ncbi:MAG TPA: N-succinylarginine dihydrolase [Tepidisphaeraceae bacterium]|jgi:succinylarginine dihydrolase
MSQAVEVNFDAIVGPTHNYAGLSYGNVASQKSKNTIANPRLAALEGLAKMKFLADLGIPQAVLPPPLRPDIATLRCLGYTGSDAAVLQAAGKDDPTLLAAVSSASSMWAANAATVSPSADTADGLVHFSPANLLCQLHRSLEPEATAAALRAIFADEGAFEHHRPLPCHARFADEGAANHTRLCADYGSPGLEVFVYGKQVSPPSPIAPKVFPARQTAEASRAVARRHQISPDRSLFIRQCPDAIDAGVFHNDVAAVGNQNVLLCHDRAFHHQEQVIEDLRNAFERVARQPLHLIQVPSDELTLAEAVETYLFNSQIVTMPDGTMALIAPSESRDHPRARAVIDQRILAADTPIKGVHFLDVRQSMRNGGGPACLRLRVVLTQAELERAHRGVFLTPELYDRLVAWVNRRYRDELRPEDLADAALLDESRAALDELTQILDLPSLYDFQHG